MKHVDRYYYPGIERADTFEQVLSTSNHLSTASTTIKYFAVNDVQQHNQLQVYICFVKRREKREKKSVRERLK